MALTDRANVASVTVTAGAVTAITMEAATLFYEFSFTAETLRFTENGSLENLSALFEQRIAGDWQGWSSADRTRLMDLYNSSACGMVCIAELENGQLVILGINVDKPTVVDKYVVRMESSAFDSGATFNDPIKNSLVLLARSSSAAAKFMTDWDDVPLS